MLETSTVTKLSEESLTTQWHAQLAIELEKNIRGTRVSRCRHEGPLYIQKPFYPEGRELAHLYLLHPPGGMVSGDHLDISLTLGTNAQGLLTTPGAGRAYRARKSNIVQRQTVNVCVGEGATMEYFPLENIFYPGANTCLSTKFELAESSRLFAWDVSSFGLPAQKEMFGSGRVIQRFEVWRDGKPMIIEQLRQDCQKYNVLASTAGFRSFPINGTFIAGPVTMQGEALDTLLETLRAQVEEVLFNKPGSIGISVVNNFVVARFLGDCSELGKKLFIRMWEILRPEILNRKSCPPRIWST